MKKAQAEKDKIRAELKKIPRAKFLGPEVGTPFGTLHEINEDFVKRKIAALHKKYPRYRFRQIECHDKPRTYTAITIDNPDPREMGEMSKYGTWDREGYYTRFEDKK